MGPVMGAVWPLLSYAAMTMAVETVILFAAGYRSRLFVQVCLLVNLATNITANLGLSLLAGEAYLIVLVLTELAVVLIEWAVLRSTLPDGDKVTSRSQSQRLLVLVFLANLVSAVCGPIFFW